MKTRKAYTILEVLVASVIFVMAAIPIYYAVAGSASKGIETTKLSMARKILESFREEIMACKYEDLETFAGGSTTFGVLNGGFPKTLSDVLAFQREYKDFDFSPEIRVNPDRSTVLEFRGSVTWTSTDGEKHAAEKLNFMVVKP
jgi:hypothetical protein